MFCAKIYITNLTRKSNRDGLLLQKYTDAQPQTIKIHAPTELTIYHNNSNVQPEMIDIVITKNLHSHTEIYALNELSSDHLPVLFTPSETLTKQDHIPGKQTLTGSSSRPTSKLSHTITPWKQNNT